MQRAGFQSGIATRPWAALRPGVVLAAMLLGAPVVAAGDPEAVFMSAPESARPGVWWHWMGCNVSRQGITRDLEAFRATGIGGASELRVKAEASNVVAVRFEFQDGPLGFNVYREINLIGASKE